MLSICSSSSSSLRLLHRNPNFWLFLQSQPKTYTFISCINSCSKDDSASIPKQIKVCYDLSEDFFGLEVDMQPRNANSRTPKQKSWFGPNGQYIKELPCPSCRGRGYTPCTKCDIERSRSDCSECNGKGMKTCQQCSGECVIWEETIDERPWERARSISPVKVKEDDYVDNLDIKLDTRKKSKRVYHSPTREVGLKISQSLKSLNARTGLFSKHMRILHRDPKLHAQRVAAIKKAKGTEAARKRASEASKAFFSDPENRRKRSVSMKGVKFYCSNCGREGHRRNYCPEIVNNSLIDRRFRCRLCGQKGHNRRTCEKIKVIKPARVDIRHHRCRVCGGSGHNRRTCSQKTLESPSSKQDNVSVVSQDRRRHYCRLCHEEGHNIRTCPTRDFKENTS